MQQLKLRETMNRQQRRRQEALRGKILANNPSFNNFEEIDLKKSESVPTGCVRAFHNAIYIITMYYEPTSKGIATKLMIQRKDNKVPVNQFTDFQRIKNEILGKDATAIQYFPPQNDLVDLHNIYWIYAFKTEQIPIPL